MLKKPTTLRVEACDPWPAVGFLIGQASFQCQQYRDYFEARCKTEGRAVLRITVLSQSDWEHVREALSHYSLFAENVWVDVAYPKKNLDAVGKAFLTQYIASPNPRAGLLITAPEWTLKTVTTWTTHANALVIAPMPPKSGDILRFIKQALDDIAPCDDARIPQLIYTYTVGDLFATANSLKKLAIIQAPGTLWVYEEVLEQLACQTVYPLEKLADACLFGHAIETLQCLRYAALQVELSYVLWHLTHHVRLLSHLDKARDFHLKAQELAIWRSRIPHYQTALKRLNTPLLMQLHHACHLADVAIKTRPVSHVWRLLESIALTLCLGREVGCLN